MCGASYRVGAFVLLILSGTPEALRASGRERLTTATLPESNEAVLLAGQVQRATQLGDYTLALELIEQIQALPPELVPAAAGRTHYPTWEEAARLQASLPAEARALFGDKFDALVRTRLERATADGDLEALEALYRRYRVSRYWSEAAEQLAARYVDQGRYGAASLVLADLARDPELRENTAALRVVSLSQLGAANAALAALERWREQGRADAGAESRAEIIADWLTRRSAQRRTQPSFEPVLGLAPAWTVEPRRGAAEEAAFDSDESLAEAVDYLRRFPAIEPALTEELLVVRTRGQLSAFDPLSLLPRWSTPVRRGAGPTGGAALERDESQGVSADAEALTNEALENGVAVAFGLVYTVEGISRSEVVQGGFGWQQQLAVANGNMLVARAPDTGEIVWAIGDDAADPLVDVAFQDLPLAVGESLVVLASRGDELLLCRLEPYSGALQQTVMLAGPPLYLAASGGRCRIVADDATVYVSTGNGVIAAIHAHDLSWCWAAQYPSLLAEVRGRRWWNRGPIVPRSAGIDRPVLAEDLVIVAPADSEFLLAFDRFDGRQRWPELNRAENAAAIGSVSRGIVLVGNRISCVSPANGSQIRWRSVPLDLVGYPVISGDRVLAPTRSGVVELDGATGKLTFVATPNGGGPGGALATLGATPRLGFALRAGEDGVFSISPNGITKQPRREVTRAWAEARRAAEPESFEAALALAWCAVLENDWAAALEHLQDARPRGNFQAEARDRLLCAAFLGRARASEDPAARLADFEAARKLAAAGGGLGALALLIGDTLAAQGDVAAARAEFAAIVASDAGAMVEQDEDPLLKVNVRELAAVRLRTLLEPLAPADRNAFLEAAGDALSPRNVSGRVRLAQIAWECGEPSRALLALDRAGAPYEYLDRLLAEDRAGATAGAGGDEARRAQWIRWAAATAVGDLRTARRIADEASFTSQAEAAGAREPGADAVSAAEIAVVARNLAKLELEQEKPFAAQALVWKWRRSANDLVPGTPGDDDGLFALMRDRESQQLQLVNLLTGDPWRATPSRLDARRSEEQLAAEAAEALHELRVVAGEAPRASWVCVRYGALGVAPAPGGLIALGLGPFGPPTRAGSRLWTHEVSEWRTRPEDFAARVAAGPAGVFLAPGRDRILRLNWLDGAVAWERALDGAEVERITTQGEQLIVMTTDQQVRAFDARSGTPRKRRAPERPGLATLFGDCIVRISQDSTRLTGADLATDAQRFVLSLEALESYDADASDRLLIVRDQGGTRVRCVELATGEVHPWNEPAGLENLESFAWSGTELFLAFQRSENDAPVVEVRCVEWPAQALRWTRACTTELGVQSGALLANPNAIPVLLLTTADDAMGDIRGLRIGLIDKTSGALTALPAIGEEFAGGQLSYAEPRLLVTPTRVVVEANGVVAAWGPSSWGAPE